MVASDAFAAEYGTPGACSLVSMNISRAGHRRIVQSGAQRPACVDTSEDCWNLVLDRRVAHMTATGPVVASVWPCSLQLSVQIQVAVWRQRTQPVPAARSCSVQLSVQIQQVLCGGSKPSPCLLPGPAGVCYLCISIRDCCLVRQLPAAGHEAVWWPIKVQLHTSRLCVGEPI